MVPPLRLGVKVAAGLPAASSPPYPHYRIFPWLQFKYDALEDEGE